MDEIFECRECGEKFDTPVECTSSGTYESDYGVSGEFPNSHSYYSVYEGCPYCNSGEFVKLYECSSCGGYFDILEDYDTKLCYDCVCELEEGEKIE